MRLLHYSQRICRVFPLLSGRGKEVSDEGSYPDGGASGDSGYHSGQRGDGRPVGSAEVEAGKARPQRELVKELDLEAKICGKVHSPLL